MDDHITRRISFTLKEGDGPDDYDLEFGCDKETTILSYRNWPESLEELHEEIQKHLDAYAGVHVERCGACQRAIARHRARLN